MGQRQSEIIKNHMEVYWHDYVADGFSAVVQAHSA